MIKTPFYFRETAFYFSDTPLYFSQNGFRAYSWCKKP